MSVLEIFELLSYVVTVFGLPLAIYSYVAQGRKERENEEAETYQQLSDAYVDFLKLVLANPDLKLRTESGNPDLTEEQLERQRVIFEMLISLFERAYLLVHDEDMSAIKQRRWNSWDDYMHEWCQRREFRALLPEVLRHEDPDFAAYIGRIAAAEAAIREQR